MPLFLICQNRTRVRERGRAVVLREASDISSPIILYSPLWGLGLKLRWDGGLGWVDGVYESGETNDEAKIETKSIGELNERIYKRYEEERNEGRRRSRRKRRGGGRGENTKRCMKSSSAVLEALLIVTWIRTMKSHEKQVRWPPSRFEVTLWLVKPTVRHVLRNGIEFPIQWDDNWNLWKKWKMKITEGKRLEDWAKDWRILPVSELMKN